MLLTILEDIANHLLAAIPIHSESDFFVRFLNRFWLEYERYIHPEIKSRNCELPQS